MYNNTILILISIIIIIIIIYVFKIILYKIECSLLYHPTKIENIIHKNKLLNEADQNVKKKFGSKTYIKEINIKTRDNELVNAIFYKSYSNNNLIIYAHGNASNIYDSIDFIYKYGHVSSILMFDYRGYGLSSGKPSDKGLKGDIFTVWDYAVDKLNYKPQNIILHGESLGCSIVSWLGRKLVSYHDNDIHKLPKAIIMQSGFYNLQYIVGDLYPKILSNLIQSKYNNIDNIINIKNNIPILVVHSDKDEMINIGHAHKLIKDSYNNNIKNIKFYQINGTHNNPLLNNQYMETFTKFINKHN